MSAKARTSTALRLTPEVHQRLIEEAEARGVSLNWLVDRLLAEAVERLVPVEEGWRLTR